MGRDESISLFAWGNNGSAIAGAGRSLPRRSAFILAQGRENSWRIDYLYPPAALVVADYAQLTAISCGYAFSHAPSLLLSAKKRRCALDFSRVRLREKQKELSTTYNLIREAAFKGRMLHRAQSSSP